CGRLAARQAARTGAANRRSEARTRTVRNRLLLSLRLSFHFHSRRLPSTHAKSFLATHELRRKSSQKRASRPLPFRSAILMSFKIPARTTTMPEEGEAVRSICDSRLDFFRECQYKL